LIAALSLGLLLLGPRSSFWGWLGGRPALATPIDTLPVAAVAAVGLILVAAFPGPSARRTLAGARVLSAGLLGVAVLLLSAHAWLRVSTVGRDGFGDAAERALFETAAAGEGLLLTGGDLHLVQLRTRRPVLIDGGGLDALPYALEAAPAMDRILREVYGVDLFHPPPQARGGGRVPPDVNRAVWERYTPDQWREIRRRHQVTQVISNADWRLQGLAPLALSRWWKLNEIPE
jgi:hypothetical protein